MPVPENSTAFRETTIPGGKKVLLYLEDCISGMNKHLEAGSIDVVVTSPPYNIGIGYSTHNDKMTDHDYLNWMESFAISVKRTLAPAGSFFLNVGSTPKNQWLAWDVAQVIKRHFILQNVFHWIKSISIGKESMEKRGTVTEDLTVGHIKPIRSERFLSDTHEYIYHFTKEGNVKLDKLSIGVPYQDKSNIKRWKAANGDRRDRGNVWFIPYDTIQSRSERPHPATFPVKLPEMCIALHGVREDTVVMDPFLGIGSSALAAVRLNVSFVGFEIDPGYIEEADSRILANIKG